VSLDPAPLDQPLDPAPLDPAPLDPVLLAVLRCPDTHHAELSYDPAGQTLTCTACGRIYEIRDGIPVLLIDEARNSSPDRAEAA